MSTDQQLTVTAAVAEFIAAPLTVPDPVVDAARSLRAATDRLILAGTGTALADRVGSTIDDLLAVGVEPPAQWRAFQLVVAAAGADGEPADAAGGWGAPVVCAALAVADEGTSETDLLAAIAAGTELWARFECAFSAARPDAPWDLRSVAARFAAVAAAGRLLGLDAPTLVQALGLAGGQSGGLALSAGTDNAVLQLARAVFDGVEATLLAQRGFTASTEIVEGVGGAGDVLYPGADFDSIQDGLGQQWASR